MNENSKNFTRQSNNEFDFNDLEHQIRGDSFNRGESSVNNSNNRSL